MIFAESKPRNPEFRKNQKNYTHVLSPSSAGRRYHEEQFCEIILNLDQWFRRKCCLKVFLIWISDSPFVQQSVTISAILVEGIMRNNSVKLF